MRSIHGAALQQAALAVVPINPTRALGNVFTTICHLSRFAADEPSVDGATLRSLLTNTLAPRRDWFSLALGGEWVKPEKMEEPLPKDAVRPNYDSFELLFAKWYGNAEVLRYLHRVIKKMIVGLVGPARVRDDYGMCLMSKLIEGSPEDANFTGFKQMWAIAPASGATREMLKCDIAFQNPLRPFEAPHLGSRSVTALAHALMILDTWRIKGVMFTPPETIDNIDSRNLKMLGQGKVIEWIVSRFAAFGILYRLAAQRLLRSVHHRARIAARTLYRQRWGERHADIMAIDDASEADYNSKVPNHPLGTYLESAWSTGEVLIEVGRHDAIYFADQPALSEPDGRITNIREYLQQRKVPDACGDRELSTLAYLYESHLARLSVYGRQTDWCASANWGWTGGDYPENQHLIEVLAALRSDPGLLTDVTNLARELGWGSLTGKLGTIDFLGADFALTDGDKSTVPMDQVVLGMTPLLSLGNRKALAITPHLSKGWHAATQGLSTVPFKGVVDVLKSKIHLERRYLPFSMCMGEEDVSPLNSINSEGSHDRVALEIRSHFSNKASKYINPFYRDLSPTPPATSRVRQTVWDPVGTSRDDDKLPDNLIADWQSAIDSQAEDSSDLTMAIRTSGKPFNGRMFLGLARGSVVYVLNQRGMYVDDVAESGTVLFDNDIEPTYDVADTDKFLALTPASNAIEVLSLTTDNLAKLTDGKM